MNQNIWATSILWEAFIVLYQRLPTLARTRTWTNVLSLLYSVQCSKNVLYIYGYFFRERKNPFLFRGPDIKWKPTVCILDIADVFFSPLKTYVGPNVMWFFSVEKNTDRSFKHFTYIHSNEFFSLSSIFPPLSSSRVILSDNEALHISIYDILPTCNKSLITHVS